MAGRTLGIGDTGDDVLGWQRFLASQGFKVATDGKFGPSTLAATRTMQRRMGVAADGKVGHRTVDRETATQAQPLPTPRPVSQPMPMDAQPGGPFTSSGPEADLSAMHSAASNRSASDAMARDLQGQYYDARQADATNQRDAPPWTPGYASDATATMPGLLMAGQSARGISPNFAAADDTAPALDVGAMGGGPQGAGLSAGTPIDPIKRDAMIRMLMQGVGV